MNMFDIPFFNLVRQQMNWLETRQNTIAENIANADTPGYDAKDIKGLDFDALVKGSAGGPAGSAAAGMMVTDAHHLTGLSQGGGGFKEIAAPDREASPNGNSVMLEDQMMKMGETQMDHEAAVGLYRKALDLLRIAVHGA